MYCISNTYRDVEKPIGDKIQQPLGTIRPARGQGQQAAAGEGAIDFSVNVEGSGEALESVNEQLTNIKNTLGTEGLNIVAHYTTVT